MDNIVNLDKVKTGFTGVYQGSIGDDLSVTVEFEIDGHYYPATRNEPEEFPEINITYVLVNGSDIYDCLSDKTLDQLSRDIDENLQENAQ